jgi:hypothetical protein
MHEWVLRNVSGLSNHMKERWGHPSGAETPLGVAAPSPIKGGHHPLLLQPCDTPTFVTVFKQS